MARKSPQQGQRLFDVMGLGGSIKTDYKPVEGDKPSAPVKLTEEELKLMGWGEDDALAEQVVTERDCSQEMVCWQYLKRKEYDEGKRAEQGELMPEDFSLEIKDSVLKPISREVAKGFIEKFEWLGTLGQYSFGYGLYFGYKLGGCACFASPGSWQTTRICGEKYSDKVILLNRGACANWCKKNTNSHLIMQALKAVERDMPYRIVLAYADERAGEIGQIYQACNWLYVGRGATGHDFVPKDLVDPTDMRFHTRGLPKELKSKERLEAAGYEVLKVKRANKHRYVAFLGGRRERKELREALRWPILPYPKKKAKK